MTFFPYRLDARWKPLFALLGVDENDGVTVASDRIVATYGRRRLEALRSNIDHTEISGPHRWYTAVGVRASFADDGLTFGTNHHRGLCIAFIEPVDRVIGFSRHSALWVSVADPEGLAEALP